LPSDRYARFVDAIQKLRLVPAERMVMLQKELGLTGEDTEVQRLGTALVLEKVLTQHQLTSLFRGDVDSLIVGKYILIDRIGAGAMGQVFKAWHPLMERLVAIKMLHPAASNDEELVRRFYREVKVVARLSHPNLVTAHDAGQHKGRCYMVSEFIDGQDLSQVVKKRGALPIAQALNYTIQAGRGLAYAHSHGVIHRDIKPGNVLLDKNGTVKVLDMGLARMTQQPDAKPDELSLTMSQHMMGTAEYMAPEQAEDAKRADHRSDIYSLGCTFFRLATGCMPYEGQTRMQVLLAHREQPIPELAAKIEGVLTELQEVFMRMVAKKPLDRFQSMNHAVAALEKVAATLKSPHADRGRKEAVPEIPHARPRGAGMSREVQGARSKPRADARGSSERLSRQFPWAVKVGLGAAAMLAVVFGVYHLVKNDQRSEVTDNTPRLANPNSEISADRSIAVLHPVSISPASAASRPDYADLATGQWVNMFDTAEKLPPLEGVRWNEGVIEVSDAHLMAPEVPVKNVLARVKVKFERGSVALYLVAANENMHWNFGYYGVPPFADWEPHTFTLLRNMGLQSAEWYERSSNGSAPVMDIDGFFEMALANADGVVTAYVNGRKVFDKRDISNPGARIQFGAGGHSFFKDAQYMRLE